VSPLGVLTAGMWFSEMLDLIRDDSIGEGNSLALSADTLLRSKLLLKATASGSEESDVGCSPENPTTWYLGRLRCVQKKVRTALFVVSHNGRAGRDGGAKEYNLPLSASKEVWASRLVLRRQNGEPLGIGSGVRRWNRTGT